MKTKFLELVEEVKTTGIVEVLRGASNPEEFESVWNEFKEKNPDLFAKANAWGIKFKEDVSILFDSEESFENPEEIAVTIFMVGNKISECDIFDDFRDLTNALINVQNDFAYAIALFIDSDYIYYITPEDFFLEDKEEDKDIDSVDNDGESDSEDGEEEAKCGEESDAHEADSDSVEADEA